MSFIKRHASFQCCYDCIAPKRHPGCHDRCNDYKAEKGKHLAAMEREKMRSANHRYAVESVMRTKERVK